MSLRRGPSTCLVASPPRSALSMAAPASAPSARPAIAPTGPPIMPPTTEPTVCRTMVAIRLYPESGMHGRGGAATRDGTRPRRPRRRHGRGSWCRAMSRRRSAWPAWSRASGRAARRRPDVTAIDLDEMLSRRRDERVGAGLRPVGRVWRRQFRLRAHDLAPDAAQQSEAIAADAFERGLVAIGRADPRAGFGDDEMGLGHDSKVACKQTTLILRSREAASRRRIQRILETPRPSRRT